MRRSLRSMLLVLAAVAPLSAGAAWADDPPGLMPSPDEKPDYGAYDMAIAEAGLPTGWKMVAVGTPNAEAAALSAEAKTVAESKQGKATTVERAVTSPDGKTVALVLVDVDENATEVAKALEASATAKGWSFKALGTPWRVLLAAGPEDARKAAVEAQVTYAGHLLAVKADSAADVENWQTAGKLAGGAVALDAKNAMAQNVLGMLIFGMSRQNLMGATVEAALPHLRAAVDKDAHDALKGDKALRTKDLLGSVLLNMKGMEKEARDVLKSGVAASKDAPRNVQLQLRYNLACAHSRLKELDEAFALLSGVLEENAKDHALDLQDGHWQKNDTDLENMRADPRWKGLLEKYDKPAGDAPKPEGDGGGEMPGK
jgi:hypothetical protein